MFVLKIVKIIICTKLRDFASSLIAVLYSPTASCVVEEDASEEGAPVDGNARPVGRNRRYHDNGAG